MHIPNNYTESEVLKIIDKVVDTLAYSFRFGYWDEEDIKQEGRMEAIKKLSKYDEKRPLDNFLYAIVKNKLINLRRDKFSRHEKPCMGCPFFDPDLKKSSNQCAIFVDKLECDKYNLWYRKNTSKRNIMEPTDISNVRDVEEVYMRTESSIVNNAHVADMFERIDNNIPMALRTDYLRMRSDVNIPKHRKQKVIEACKDILREALNEEEEG